MSSTHSTTIVREWVHSRKGRIVGRVVRETEDWVTIELAGDHGLRYASEEYRGRIDRDGDYLTVRKSFLSEVTQ